MISNDRERPRDSKLHRQRVVGFIAHPNGLDKKTGQMHRSDEIISNQARNPPKSEELQPMAPHGVSVLTPGREGINRGKCGDAEARGFPGIKSGMCGLSLADAGEIMGSLGSVESSFLTDCHHLAGPYLENKFQTISAKLWPTAHSWGLKSTKRAMTFG